MRYRTSLTLSSEGLSSIRGAAIVTFFVVPFGVIEFERHRNCADIRGFRPLGFIVSLQSQSDITKDWTSRSALVALSTS